MSVAMFSKNKIRSCRQRGATLIEALVSILVLSLGLLGMAGLQLNALSFQKSSWAQHRVSELTTDIVERMQTNPFASQRGQYNYTQTYAISAAANLSSAGCQTATFPCTAQQIAGDDLSSWMKKAQQTLPGGAASISGNATQGFVVTAMYLDKDFRDAVTNAASTSTSCTAALTGNAWRNCCPPSANVPSGIRCTRTPFFVYVASNLAAN